MRSKAPESTELTAGSDAHAARRQRRRRWLDRLAARVIAAGGLGVIVAVLLILVFLIKETWPLFTPATVSPPRDINTLQQPPRAFLYTDAQFRRLLHIDSQGLLRVQGVGSGEWLEPLALLPGSAGSLTQVVRSRQMPGWLALATQTGAVHLVNLQIPNLPTGVDIHQAKIGVEAPLGSVPLLRDLQNRPLQDLQLRMDGRNLSVLALTQAGELLYRQLALRTNPILQTREFVLQPTVDLSDWKNEDWQRVLLAPDHDTVYLLDAAGDLYRASIRQTGGPRLPLFSSQDPITDLGFLLGDFALIVAHRSGRVTQWNPVSTAQGSIRLAPVRDFETRHSGQWQLAFETDRKGFYAWSPSGHVHLFATTPEREVLGMRLDPGLRDLLPLPRAEGFLVLGREGQLQQFGLEAPHADVSFSALWQPVWYEGYSEPRHIWQSSSADADFEPKYGLMPLVVGTLKAAFYALFLAIPLALGAAVYTAYFMRPRLRRVVKPAIELMEAVPTVVLGLLAGLFLAPIIERQLPAILSLLVILPGGALLMGLTWTRLPGHWRHRLPPGALPLLLMPWLLLLVCLALLVSPILEERLLGGNAALWMTQSLGLDFSQRNAIVVGVAMAFAVIPTIYSLAEDALHGVPRQLTFGSTALGASEWQTLYRVILPAAAPGILSAVMVGLGRAVGETMIVLMATGNTPIMDFNPFEGMRTLAANIAIEMPEAEPGATHYRLLFLTGLLLLLFTFTINALAELIRQRLRLRYAALGGQ